MVLSVEQIEVATDWWSDLLAYMYNLSEQEKLDFQATLRSCLADREATSIDTRKGLPEELQVALAKTEVGSNAAQRLKAVMGFPNGGVLVYDGTRPHAAAKRQRKLIQQADVFVRTPTDIWPASLLRPFPGIAVVEEWLGHCLGAEVKDGKRIDHDKVWAACLEVSCVEDDVSDGLGQGLKWTYHARFGPRRGTIDEHIVRFSSDEKETEQQKAAKRYQEKVREHIKRYTAAAFDSTFTPESYYRIETFAAFLPTATFAL